MRFSSNGQNHDRLLEDDGFSIAAPPTGAGTGDDDTAPEITAVQKMVSAMSGSLFTSLLGRVMKSSSRAAVP